MDIKIKKKDLCILDFTITVVAIFIIVYFTTQNIIWLFLCNILLFLEIIIKCKISLISLKILIIDYILFPLYFQYTTGFSYGILEVNRSIDIDYELLLISIIIYNFSIFSFVLITDYLTYEKEKLKKNYYISGNIKYIICVIAILCSIIAFPRLPFSYSSSNRFTALLPGNAWNHIVIICLILLLGNLNNDKLVLCTYIFCIFWFLSHFERVDMIGLIILILIKYLFKKNIKINILKNIKVLIIVFTIVSIMVFIGYKRSNNSNDFKLFRNILIQSTSADEAYVFAISIDYAKNHKKLLGITYIDYLVNIIPFMDYDKNVSSLLKNNYAYPGGEYILSAPMINFGLIGIPFFAFIEVWILKKLLKSKLSISTLIYIFIITVSFRINWYGFIYIEKGLLYFLPFFYWLVRKNFNWSCARKE